MSLVKSFVKAEVARTDMVVDPYKIADRSVEIHAFRNVYSGPELPAHNQITIEVHDPLGMGCTNSVLLHFDAEVLMRMLTQAMLHADA